jgi:hypothetical protein
MVHVCNYCYSPEFIEWFPDYYSRGFLAGMGSLVAAAGMLIANLVILSPMLNLLSKKYARNMLFLIIPFIMFSAFGQFYIMFLLD